MIYNSIKRQILEYNFKNRKHSLLSKKQEQSKRTATKTPATEQRVQKQTQKNILNLSLIKEQDFQIERGQSLQHMVLEQLDVQMQKKKKKARHRPYIFHKNEIKLDYNPNRKCKTIKIG